MNGLPVDLDRLLLNLGLDPDVADHLDVDPIGDAAVDGEVLEQPGEGGPDCGKPLGIGDLPGDCLADLGELGDGVALDIADAVASESLLLGCAEPVRLGLCGFLLGAEMLPLLRPVVGVDLAVLEVSADPCEPLSGLVSLLLGLDAEGVQS